MSLNSCERHSPCNSLSPLTCCRDGEIAGRLEGRDLGIQKGLELGTEVGYYSGCAQVTGPALKPVDTVLDLCSLLLGPYDSAC